jgi:hypothetical protein
MSTPFNSGNWQTLLELRRRREIILRWLANRLLADDVHQALQMMLDNVDAEIRLLTGASR